MDFFTVWSFDFNHTENIMGWMERQWLPSMKTSSPLEATFLFKHFISIFFFRSCCSCFSCFFFKLWYFDLLMNSLFQFNWCLCYNLCAPIKKSLMPLFFRLISVRVLPLQSLTDTEYQYHWNFWHVKFQWTVTDHWIKTAHPLWH